MVTDFTKETDKEIRRQMGEWTNDMFTEDDGKASINSVMKYSPLIQMLSNELTGRFVKRTTLFALGVAVLSLVVSLAALYVAYRVR